MTFHRKCQKIANFGHFAHFLEMTNFWTNLLEFRSEMTRKNAKPANFVNFYHILSILLIEIAREHFGHVFNN